LASFHINSAEQQGRDCTELGTGCNVPSPGTEQEGRTRQRRVRPSAFLPGRSPCRRAALCVFPAVIYAGGHLCGSGARPGRPTGRAMDAELFATEGNPIPENATAGRLVMRDGV